MAAEVTKMSPAEREEVRHDGELAIAYGSSRYETNWKNRQIRWSALLARLRKSMETPETHAEYMKMPRSRQDNIKDIGGFMGGHLKGGRKKKENIETRQIVTLDAESRAEFLKQGNSMHMNLTEGSIFLDVQEKLDELEGEEE